jgi:hypothetical protein
LPFVVQAPKSDIEAIRKEIAMNNIFEVYANVYRTAMFQRPSHHQQPERKPVSADRRVNK